MRSAHRIMLIGATLASVSGCLSDGPEDDLQRRLQRDLMRTCMAHAGGPRIDTVDLLGGRMHSACFRWAHRQARRMGPS